MAIPYETAVIEDFATGYGTKSVSMPGGGSATGNKVNRGNIPAPTSRCGTVHVYPPTTYVGKSIVYAPDGSEVSTSGSTTSGLQEAITYAANNGYDIHIHGGDEAPAGGGGSVVYNMGATATLDWPAMQGKSIIIDACTINFPGSGGETCMRFDSCMMVHFTWRGGQIASSRTGNSLLFDPRTNVPLDAVKAIIDSKFDFSGTAVASTNASAVAQVRFRTNTGDITHSEFFFSEINGGISAIQVDKPTGAFAFAYNRIACRHAHGQYGTSPIVLVGDSAGATNAQIRDNFWDLHIEKEATGGGDGFLTRATRDRGLICLAGIANTQIDVMFQDQAALCDLELATDTTVADYATVVSDTSTAKNNRISGLPVRARITPGVGASPYVYPADSNDELLPRDHQFLVTGGTVSVIAVSFDGGSTWDTTGATSGMFLHTPGIRHRITYSVAPTIVAHV